MVHRVKRVSQRTAIGLRTDPGLRSCQQVSAHQFKNQLAQPGPPGALINEGTAGPFYLGRAAAGGEGSGILSFTRAGCDCLAHSSVSPVMGDRGEVNWRPSIARADRERPPAIFWSLLHRCKSDPPAGGIPYPRPAAAAHPVQSPNHLKRSRVISQSFSGGNRSSGEIPNTSASAANS